MSGTRETKGGFEMSEPEVISMTQAPRPEPTYCGLCGGATNYAAAARTHVCRCTAERLRAHGASQEELKRHAAANVERLAFETAIVIDRSDICILRGTMAEFRREIALFEDKDSLTVGKVRAMALRLHSLLESMGSTALGAVNRSSQEREGSATR